MNISIHIKLILEFYYLLNGKHIHLGYQRSGSKMNVQKKKHSLKLAQDHTGFISRIGHH